MRDRRPRVVAARVRACALRRLHARRARKTLPSAPPLDVPAPPPRVVVPATEAEAPPPVAAAAEPARSTPPRPPRRRARVRRSRPSRRSSREPPRRRRRAPPQDAAAAGADAADDADRGARAKSNARFARRWRARPPISNRIDYRALNADARTQYDTAKRFIAAGRARRSGRRTSSSRRTWPTRRRRSRLNLPAQIAAESPIAARRFRVTVRQSTSCTDVNILRLT